MKIGHSRSIEGDTQIPINNNHIKLPILISTPQILDVVDKSSADVHFNIEQHALGGVGTTHILQLLAGTSLMIVAGFD